MSAEDRVDPRHVALQREIAAAAAVLRGERDDEDGESGANPCPMPCLGAPMCPCFDFQLPDTPEGWAGDWDAYQPLDNDEPQMVPFDCPKRGGVCYETACLHFNECREGMVMA